MRARPRGWVCVVSSAMVASRSALASATVEHTSVLISIVLSISSCLALGGRSVPEPSAMASRISEATLVSWRLARSTISSSTSIPRLERCDAWKSMFTPQRYSGSPLALSRAPSRGLSRARLLHDVVDDVLRAARPGKGPALAHSAGAVTQRCVDQAGDLVALAELIEGRGDEVQEGGDHLPG